MRINSNDPLFIETIKRFINKNFYDATLIGNYEHRFLLKNFLDNYKIKHRSIILEPFSKNTLISAILSVLEIKSLDKNAKILIVPADQIIKDKKKLINNILESSSLVDSGYINTFGIKPTHPSTQFGYIKPKKKKYCLITRVKLKVFWKNLIKRKQINFLNQNPTFGILAFSFFQQRVFQMKLKLTHQKLTRRLKRFFGEKKSF